MAWIAAAVLLAATAGWAWQDASPRRGSDAPMLSGGAAFTVGGIEVDFKAGSAEAAREAAFREAMRQAWPRLWARLTGGEAASAPELGDAAIKAMVAGIEIERERFAEGGRYIASLGVVFDRQRAGQRLPATARIVQSRPMLLVPLLSDAGATGVFGEGSEWNAAWNRFATDSSLIDYVRAAGSLGDRLLLNGWQARRSNRDLWRMVLARYRAENVLVAEARFQRSFPGGPIDAEFHARYGPDSRILDRFSLRADSPGELPGMLDEAVRRIDAAYAQALQDGRLKADETLVIELAPLLVPEQMIGPQERTVSVSIPTQDEAAWLSVQALANSAPSVAGLVAEALAIGATTRATLSYTGEYEALRADLDERGLRLEPGDGGLRLRRRQPGEAPISVSTGVETERVEIPLVTPPPPPEEG